MPADNVALAVMAMEEKGVRQKVRDGDLAALGDLVFSPKEEELVRAAADDESDAEVAGFSFTGGGTMAAASYVYGNIASPEITATWLDYTTKLGWLSSDDGSTSSPGRCGGGSR